VTNRQLGRSVLEGMSETSRALVVGSLVEDEEHADLAQKHGVSTKTVGRKLKRAIEQARSLLKKRGGG
jgi:DNA-directed RNA polymerase specialized sigma24 family protein